MKKILIVHTGGTISMEENKDTGGVNITDKHPLRGITSQFESIADVEEKILFDMPSPHITPTHMVELSNELTKLLPRYDGIVITHGTDTLEETAYLLDLVLETKKPVILTGAMRSSNEIGSDGIYNLLSSLRVAVDDEAINKGVLVVMNDEIHAARNVVKTSTTNIATFKSPQHGPIGIVIKQKVVFHHEVIKQQRYPISKLNTSVILLKAYAGMDAQIIEAVHQTKPNGVVIEAFGQGNLPAELELPLKKLLQDQIPVILVSRCHEGHVQPTYSYLGGGKQLKDLGIIFAGGLSGPKARLKLLVGLEFTKNTKKLEELFQ